ncbi:MAG: type II toxin-antitoxin system VapB family antitoxin [Nitrospirae bacterium]|nr:type II toxin-antitoxin system VapB family antitoxin [Nitrospirota bacterium]
MRATIEIDDRLFEEAKKLTSVKTKKELINLSLRELIRRKKIEHLFLYPFLVVLDFNSSFVIKFKDFFQDGPGELFIHRCFIFYFGCGNFFAAAFEG